MDSTFISITILIWATLLATIVGLLIERFFLKQEMEEREYVIKMKSEIIVTLRQTIEIYKSRVDYLDRMNGGIMEEERLKLND
jgi:hypothetical protein